MAPGGKMFRYSLHFGENVLPYGSHEWLPYSMIEVHLKTVNTNLPIILFLLFYCPKPAFTVVKISSAMAQYFVSISLALAFMASAVSRFFRLLVLTVSYTHLTLPTICSV